MSSPKQIHVSTTVSGHITAMAIVITLLDRLWTGEREKVLIGIAAYFGFTLVRRT